MIVENYKTKKTVNKSVDCLFKEFGAGVHLIKKKSNEAMKLLIIYSQWVDVLFVDEDNTITAIKSYLSNAIPYLTFYDDYEYIKKLDMNELFVRINEAKE